MWKVDLFGLLFVIRFYFENAGIEAGRTQDAGFTDFHPHRADGGLESMAHGSTKHGAFEARQNRILVKTIPDLEFGIFHSDLPFSFSYHTAKFDKCQVKKNMIVLETAESCHGSHGEDFLLFW